MSTRKIRVGVVYGGSSGEHPISIATAGAVMRALDPERYDVVPIAIRKDGTWVPGETDATKLNLDAGLLEVEDSGGRLAIPAGEGEQDVIAFTAPEHDSTVTVRAARELSRSFTSLGKLDVIFPLLHGPFGEDGTIQGLFEMAGIPYVGCGVFASAAAMDKHYTKVVLQAAGLPIGPYTVVTARRWRENPEAVREEARQLELPLFVKPSRAGSSIGISKVDRYEDLDVAIEEAQKHDPKVLIEQGIKGREIECAVLGGRGDSAPRASVLGEVILDVPDDAFYDFEHKYLATESLTMSIPAQISEESAAKIRAQACEAFDAIGGEGMSRVDFFLTDSGETYVIEINTIPGFTPYSMYPVLWENTGLAYSELLDELIALAMERPIGLR